MEGKECLRNTLDTLKNCQESACEGVYADVAKTEEEPEKDAPYNRMIANYRELKKQYVKNIGFNASNYDNLFGKIKFQFQFQFF